MIMIHDFHKSLALSDAVSLEPWWEEVYRKAFPYFKSMERVPAGTPQQRAGVDRIVHLQGGAAIFVEEKVRHSDHDDILLEILSSEEHRTHGWACKQLGCEYVAYAFLPSRRCYFFPFQQLQKALANNWNRWRSECETVLAKNRGYTTVSLAVPIDVLQRAIVDASLVRWDRTDISN